MANLINSIIVTDADKLNGAPIPNRDAVNLIKEYWETEGTGPKKTKAVWFSIDDLNMILALIAKHPNGDGVRIFFGKYPEESVLKPPSNDYIHMNTLVFVPTVGVGTDRHINVFDIDDLIDHPEKLTTASDAANHGQLCPQKM